MRLGTARSSLAIMSTDGAKVAPTSPPAVAEHRYLALDALRGAAAFAVLFYHLRNLETPDRATAGFASFASGYLAVDFFFVLSGFVLAHAYGERWAQGLTPGRFMLARFVRLQPMIAVGTLLGFALALSQRLLGLPGAPGLTEIGTSLVLNLLILPNPMVPWGIFLFNPPIWSLFYEMLACLVLALGMRRAFTGRAARQARISGCLLVACAAGLLGLIASVVLTGNLDRGVVLKDWPVGLARIAFSFSLGLLLHRSRRYWMRRIPSVPVIWLLLACLGTLAFSPSGVARSLYDLAFVTLISPVIVALGAVSVPTVRTRPIAEWLGAISYPLYAIHAPIKHIADTFVPLNFLPLLTLTTIVVVATAWLLARFVDPAMRRALSGVLMASRQRASKASKLATTTP